MSRVASWVGLAAVVLLGIGFATANAGRDVSVDLGLFTLHGVPVTFVAFGGMVAGMAVVFAAGIHADLKVRRLLRERHLDEDRRVGGAGSASSITSTSTTKGEKPLE